MLFVVLEMASARNNIGAQNVSVSRSAVIFLFKCFPLPWSAIINLCHHASSFGHVVISRGKFRSCNCSRNKVSTFKIA